MKGYNLQFIEEQLKKRLQLPYKWGQRQNDRWDGYTRFIYEINTWDLIVARCAKVSEVRIIDQKKLLDYAANRWFNFWSAMAVEEIFSEMANVLPVQNIKDSTKDFYLNAIPFDHKTTVFPKMFNKSFEYAQANKVELIEWLYKNQSTQKRHHLKNRLFIVVYDKNGEHWKLKAEISLLRKAVHEYVVAFKPEQLHSVIFAARQTALSDIIWVSK